MKPNSSNLLQLQSKIDREHYAINEQFKQKEVEDLTEKTGNRSAFVDLKRDFLSAQEMRA
jgi:uncharacterized protein YgiM (DUF1202 family)